MTLKIAAHWMEGGGQYPCLPTISEIQRFKDIGFNAVMFGEIRYGSQKQDFDDIFANKNGWSKTNNPMLTTIRDIQNNGMKAFFIMNPNRYTDVPETLWLFLGDVVARSKFLSAISYLCEIGIDGIEFEEPTFYTGFEKSNIFFRECRARIPNTILFGLNAPSNSPEGIAFDSIDVVTINNERLIDFLQIQPGKSKIYPYPITNDIILGSYNAWKGYLPDIPIYATLYVTYSCALPSCRNNNLYSNLQYVTDNNWDFALWFADLIGGWNFDYPTIKGILTSPDTCPTPQYTYTITQE